MLIKPPAIMEFHVSRRARDRYQFDEVLFAQSGNVIFTNFHAARVFAQKMNGKRDLARFPEQAVQAGQINAMGLIDEILHLVVDLYRQEKKPEVMHAALSWLNERLGQDAVDLALRAFVHQFPPVVVYQRQLSEEAYLAGESGGTPNREIALEEMLILWLSNANPGFAPYHELFDDHALAKETAYPQIITLLHSFFDNQPTFGPQNQNLIDMLRSPALASPHSLSGQLEFIRTAWGSLLGRLLFRLFSSLDLIKEEENARFRGMGGPGPAVVSRYLGTGIEFEPERFSQDKDWMPRLLLIAKNSYVWLDQLSKKYHRPINRLDQIPDEELDTLARWGFTGLWLIGLWERSQASRQIKQLRGNPEAVASAYSLFSYDIAADLGGDEAYRDLSRRAWDRGIRLSSDMVPNHMGIDSRWVIEHPDWFIQLNYSPFPSYTFNGPNLSRDERVGLYIEDHYYDNSDAAVVFKRVDFHTGDTRYIYHGNDGTSMPWNDTAQLNYLLPEVREAVIQTILHVARKFPVIRFDAAMTLAKKHFQRLWFPEPGTGGAIPSRAEHALSQEQFNALLPNEFWREVVDRVAQEVPDTLLLAEAFWLMEGYFVRTLGMHRVYNSAFMNMLRDEKNADYRLSIKNTLEFDPEILKRYVNFMNNPDERTAVDQFGKDDKYFGVAVVLSTIPGLPMFGHGQIEGFTERYGMEYRRAYWDETADPTLVARHEREIFPLLRRRYLFAQVKDFLLYDFFAPEGFVNDDVLAYSNRSGGEFSLVVYHNKFASARGWIRTSAAFTDKTGPERRLIQRSLAEGLELSHDENMFTIFRDHITGLEFIRSNRELVDSGLYVELEAYKYQVFLDFRQVADNEWRQYAQLNSYLNGRGVPSIDEALREIFLQPVLYPFRELVNAGFFKWIIDNQHQKGFQAGSLQVERSKGTSDPGSSSPQPVTFNQILDEAEGKALNLLNAIRGMVAGSGREATPVESIVRDMRQELSAALQLTEMEEMENSTSTEISQAVKFLLQGPKQAKAPSASPLSAGDIQTWGTLLGWLFIHNLGRTVDASQHATEVSRSWIDEWWFGKLTAAALQELGLDETTAWQAVAVIKLVTGHSGFCSGMVGKTTHLYPLLQSWLIDGELQRFIGVNRYQGILWFNHESFHNLLWWMYTASVINILAESAGEPEKVATRLAACYTRVQQIESAESAAGYQVEKLLEAAKGSLAD